MSSHFVAAICFWHRLYPVDKSRVNEFGQSFDPVTSAPADDPADTSSARVKEVKSKGAAKHTTNAPEGLKLRKNVESKSQPCEDKITAG